ncbi:hypothetical protein AYO41_04775 [Verrucomicrobia bacterium SCGC AG-212-E04]|nr:hypothetical protein AYO41_04775 [Verrucomicrobia bacterium SCGC AG-212-E04]
MKSHEPLESVILAVRGQRVIVDSDLAALYGVQTKRLNEQVKRNAERFPADFAFQLTSLEWEHLRSQIATLKSGRGQHRKYLPFAFTEHGALMAANVLNSPDAVHMSVHVVRAFIKQRELLWAHADVLRKLAQMDAELLEHDDALRVIWHELQALLNPQPDPPKPQIGFGVGQDSLPTRSHAAAAA